MLSHFNLSHLDISYGAIINSWYDGCVLNRCDITT